MTLFGTGSFLLFLQFTKLSLLFALELWWLHTFVQSDTCFEKVT